MEKFSGHSPEGSTSVSFTLSPARMHPPRKLTLFKGGIATTNELELPIRDRLESSEVRKEAAGPEKAREDTVVAMAETIGEREMKQELCLLLKLCVDVHSARQRGLTKGSS